MTPPLFCVCLRIAYTCGFSYSSVVCYMLYLHLMCISVIVRGYLPSSSLSFILVQLRLRRMNDSRVVLALLILLMFYASRSCISPD